MKTKLLGAIAIFTGLFLCVGFVSASDADVLQPAGATTSLESLRVGVAGQGGVTFFNGTVLNEGSDPFTVGDDMRVDGRVYRGDISGPASAPGDDTPFIINDDLEILGEVRGPGSIEIRDPINANGGIDILNEDLKVYNGGIFLDGDAGNLGSIGTIGDQTLSLQGPVRISGSFDSNYSMTVDGRYTNGDRALEILGKLKLGKKESFSCSSSNVGVIYYDTSINEFRGCKYDKGTYIWKNL